MRKLSIGTTEPMAVAKGKDRRDHPRHTAHVIMEIRGHVQGSDITEIRGVTADMSSSGALAVFTDHVAARPGDTFMVRFVDETGAVIAPEFRWGTVIRSERVRQDYVVAVRFRRPLPRAVLWRLLSADLAATRRVAYA